MYGEIVQRQSLQTLFANRPRIVVTADFSPRGVATLRALGDVTLLGWAAGGWFASDADLRQALRDADVLVAGYEPVTAGLLDAAPRLRLVASIRQEPRVNVDVDAATERGIPVLYTLGRCDDGVAEFTIGVALALTRNLLPAVEWMRRPPAGFAPGDEFHRGTVWGDLATSPQLLFRGIELAGRTFGIVGLGGIGRAVARRLTAFSMRLLAFDPYVPELVARESGASLVSLEQLLEESHVVSLHARLTPTSRGMIGRRELERTRAGSYLINTARAGLLDRAALLAALDSGHLAGAAIDVFDEEPPSALDPLVAHPRVLPTPHVAAWTRELTDHHSDSLTEEILRVAAGQAPRQVANPEVLSDAERAA
jgi:phosphoglycerate dehydrogenase-like enzyme